MRIAVVTSHFPVVSETFVLRQVTGLMELGHDVRIFADGPGEPGPVHPAVAEYGLRERTTYVDIPALAGYWDQPAWPIWGRTWRPGAERPVWNVARVAAATPAFARALARAPRLTARVLRPRHYGGKARSLSPLYRLARMCEERQEFDAIHVHFGWTAHDYRFLADLWGAPLVATFHGGGDVDFGGGFDMRSYYADLFQRSATLTIAVSRYTKERLERLGCPPSKLRVVPSGVDIVAFEFRERTLVPGDSVRVLSVGRLVEMKGHEYAIRALASARERAPGIQLDIVGDGPRREELGSLADSLGVGDAVRFRGAQPASEVRRLMADAHLFLLASVTPRDGDHEGQTIALQEAQASGLPVVASDHGPFPEILVPGESALLAPERDAEGLADALVAVAGQPERWPAMGRAGRAHVERLYDARALDRRLESVLGEARELAVAENRSRAAPITAVPGEHGWTGS